MSRRPPDLTRLVAASRALATALGLPTPSSAEMRLFFERTLYADADGGGREAWPCLLAGVLTEAETRNLLLARCSTFIASRSGRAEPQLDLRPLEAEFDDALFGRPARPA